MILKKRGRSKKTEGQTVPTKTRVVVWQCLPSFKKAVPPGPAPYQPLYLHLPYVSHVYSFIHARICFQKGSKPGGVLAQVLVPTLKRTPKAVAVTSGYMQKIDDHPHTL